MPSPDYPFKRLIVCCDGTWQASNHGNRSVPSNVAKISRAISCYGYDTQDEKVRKHVPQVVYYDAGVGTAMGWLDKTYSGAFGEGLTENVCEAYNFLVNNHEKGDEVYIFGFSRGAYTARALAGLVANVGICRNDMMDQFWEMYNVYCRNTGNLMTQTWWGKNEPPDASKDPKVEEWQFKGHGKEWLAESLKYGGVVNIKVVGVFDTVGSLGWPDSDIGNMTSKNNATKYGFHDTNIHENIKNAFHAIALDEKRRAFAPTLWHKPEGSITNLCQCWFPGVHINIGGGSEEGLKQLDKSAGDLESMANITFAWMVDRVREVSLLNFDIKAIFRICDRYAENLEQLLERKNDDKEVYRGWGVGPIKDSFDSQSFLERTVGGKMPRAPGQGHMVLDPIHKPKEYFALSPDRTNEYFHPVIYHATKSPFGPSVINPSDGKQFCPYKPVALEGFNRVGLDAKINSIGRVYWEKDVEMHKQSWREWAGNENVKPDPLGSRKVIIPEFVIPYEKDFPFFSLERMLIAARPKQQRMVIEAAFSRLGQDQKKDYVQMHEKIADPETSDAERARAKAALKKFQTDLEKNGQVVGEGWVDNDDGYYLTKDQKIEYDEWAKKDKTSLLKDAENAEKFLEALDKENLRSTERQRYINPEDPSKKGKLS